MNPRTTDLSPLLDQQLIRDEAAEPIFIVGSVRSGTSIVVNALRGGAGIKGFHEGNVGTMVQRMLDELDGRDSFGGDLEFSVGQEKPYTAAAALRTHIVNDVAALYIRTMGPGQWLDKSPESYLGAPMIRFCPTLLEVFPKARFVWCVRRGIENIMSRQRKFPGIPFRSFCRSWTDAVLEWRNVRDRLAGRYLEVHQEQIAIHPDRVSADLASFLSLSRSQRQAVEDVFTNKRLEQSQVAQDHRWIGLDETPWDAEQRNLFRDICGEMMAALDYGMEARTLSPAGPIHLFYPVTQTAVETRHVTAGDGGFWKAGPSSLGLHPNPPGSPPASVRYKNIPLQGQSRFFATLAVPSEAKGPVLFAFRLEESAGGRTLAEGSREVQPGTEVPWELVFHSPEGVCDIVISTQMAPSARTADGAAATWHDARLENVID